MTPYPLKFDPIFKSMLWGGDRLRPWLGGSPSPDPTGEAWVLSDVDGSESVVANGPLKGRTLRSLLPDLGFSGRFPLLCKFLDTRQELSVQVHPNDAQAHAKFPGQRGKTEAWVILDADPATSRIYAGFKPGVTAEAFRAALGTKSAASLLHSYNPSPGDCVFLRAGTVHAIGSNLQVFEVQQSSDITYRLYDWDRVDAKTGKPRQLHVEDGLACCDFAAGPCDSQVPMVESESPVKRERLAACEYFTLHRLTGDKPFPVAAGRIVVGLAGSGRLEREESLNPGDTYLLPKTLDGITVEPNGPMTVLEIGLGSPLPLGERG